MAEKMKQYMREQMECWESILRQPLSPGAGWNPDWKETKHLVLFGSGSSYYAGRIAAEFLKACCGMRTTVLTPSELYGEARFWNPEETLTAALSQSGKSVTTLDAMHFLKEQGFSVLAMTADPASPIACQADSHLEIACGEETVGPKTKGMTATVLTLYQLGLSGLLGTRAQADAIRESLMRGAENGRINLERAETFFEENREFFTGADSLMILGDEAAFASCQEGALKILETLYIPAQALELEEYTHGVQNTIRPGQHHILAASSEESSSRMERLNRYQQQKGCENLLLTPAKTQGAGILNLAHTGQAYTVFMELLPVFHVFSALGSEALDINCDLPKFDDFYGVMDTKL